MKQASTPSSVRSDERFGIVSETSEDNLPVLEEIATPTATVAATTHAAVEPVAETTKRFSSFVNYKRVIYFGN